MAHFPKKIKGFTKMINKRYKTEYGTIFYKTNKIKPNELCLVMLPGLTADHRLFEKQIEYFEDKYNIFVWDAPGHNESRPFKLEFSLMDKAKWLNEILELEGIQKPVIIGQSMGGYVAQAYMEQYKDKLKGFISIDSAPLQKLYMQNWEIKPLKKMESVYRWYPWKLLLQNGSKGTAQSHYGQALMREMMESYNPGEYARLAGHGYRILAEAIEEDLSYEIYCPALLLCGEKDKAGKTKKYNLKWHKKTGLALKLIPNAGHNSNTDKAELVNELIEQFVESLIFRLSLPIGKGV